MRAQHLIAAFGFAALLTLGGASAAPTVASASPGVCKCNKGCHANPGQCLQTNACSLGYAPSCGFRGGDSGTTECPKVDFISCNGMCSCVPIPGFCETIGGADYCDAGPPDTGPADTFVPDTTATDTFVPDTTTTDTFVPDTAATDTFVPDTASDTFVPDTTPPPDTFVADSGTPTDTFVPDTFVADSGTPTDTFVPDTFVADTFVPDTCVPLECPPGTKAIPVPGECDPFCAQPCGKGEFKCFPGTECTEAGVCVPKCLVTGCAECKKCSLGDGTCFDDPAGCADGGATDGAGGDGAGDDGASTDGAGGDGSTDPDSTVDPDAATDGSIDPDATSDGSTDDDGGGLGDNPDAETGATGGCNCSLPGSGSDTALLGVAAVALAVALSRRRKP